MISDRAQHRPTRRGSIDPPQRFIETWVFAYPSQIGRRHKNAKSPMVVEYEVAFERTIELAWCVVSRPNRTHIHAHGHNVAAEAHFDARPTPSPCVMNDFPWAHAAYYREHKSSAGLQQSSAFR